MGLSTQVPGRYVYLSDGPARTYEVVQTELVFENTALKEAGFKLRESALIVQGLKSLGRVEWEAMKLQCLQKEKQDKERALQVRKKTGCIPDTNDLDRLLKYEGSIERRFYRALNELERLQRMRSGDRVPAPVNINLAVNTEDTA